MFSLSVFVLDKTENCLILGNDLEQRLAGAERRGHVGHVRHHVRDVQARATLKALPSDA